MIVQAVQAVKSFKPFERSAVGWTAFEIVSMNKKDISKQSETRQKWNLAK